MNSLGDYLSIKMSMARYEVSDALSILLVKSRVFRDHSQDEFERKLSIIMGENLYFQEERENGFLVFSFNAQDHGTLNFPLNHDQKNYLWQRIGVYELRYGSYTYERSDSYQQQLRIPTLQISNSTAAGSCAFIAIASLIWRWLPPDYSYIRSLHPCTLSIIINPRYLRRVINFTNTAVIPRCQKVYCSCNDEV